VRRLELDEDSSAILTLEPGLLPPLRIAVALEGQPVLAGTLAFERGALAKQLTVRSSWMLARGTGASRFRVASRDGRFVLGRKTLLVIDTSVGEKPVLPAEAELELEGFRSERGSTLDSSTLDSRGRFVLAGVPTDLIASVRLRLRASAEESVAQIPVDQQGFWAERHGDSAQIQSLVPLSHLHYAIVSARALWARGRVELRCDTAATCSASIGLPGAVPGDERFIVLGREPALDGPLSIGWALDGGSEEPKQTTLFREALLIDGMIQARQVERARATRRTTQTMAGFGVVGTAFLLTVLMRLWSAQRKLERHSSDDPTKMPPHHTPFELGGTEDAPLPIPMVSSKRSLGWVLFLTLSLLALGLWVWIRSS
jgi:hypothetical protein